MTKLEIENVNNFLLQVYETIFCNKKLEIKNLRRLSAYSGLSVVFLRERIKSAKGDNDYYLKVEINKSTLSKLAKAFGVSEEMILKRRVEEKELIQNKKIQRIKEIVKTVPEEKVTAWMVINVVNDVRTIFLKEKDADDLVVHYKNGYKGFKVKDFPKIEVCLIKKGISYYSANGIKLIVFR